MQTIDCLVAGAGVVGIAAARALAAAGREVIVVDAAETIGTQTSSRNSEVVHAGIYYQRDSLMARMCVEGRRRLYAYCDAHGVPYKRCGKLIVATNSDEAEQLLSIKARAEANGVEGMRLLTAAETLELEPELACVASLLSPETGIVDSHAYMLALQGDAENDGAAFVFRSPVISGRACEDGIAISVGGDTPIALKATTFVNAAGLYAPSLAQKIEGMPECCVPKAHFAKGHYFTLESRTPFSHLVYPVPVPGGLGVHLTLDMGGCARFGPDVEWIDDIDYSFDVGRAASFYSAIRKYWPGLRDGALRPGYCGIRPKIVPKGAPGQDFVLQGEVAHGIPGLINFFGIESPGLTAAIALAEMVKDYRCRVEPSPSRAVAALAEVRRASFSAAAMQPVTAKELEVGATVTGNGRWARRAHGAVGGLLMGDQGWEWLQIGVSPQDAEFVAQRVLGLGGLWFFRRAPN